MTDPEAFYNREDLWTVATEVGMSEGGEQRTQVMQPNFVLMKLPGEDGVEFVLILPFTRADRNNFIGWIAGRSDGDKYGASVVYNFRKTKLVDGPLQIEARMDQNAQLSGQLTLWNQQGSTVRRGALLVNPTGKALLSPEREASCRLSAVQCRNCVWSCSRCKIASRTDQLSSPRWRRCLADQLPVVECPVGGRGAHAHTNCYRAQRGPASSSLNGLISQAARRSDG